MVGFAYPKNSGPDPEFVACLSLCVCIYRETNKNTLRFLFSNSFLLYKHLCDVRRVCVERARERERKRERDVGGMWRQGCGKGGCRKGGVWQRRGVAKEGCGKGGVWQGRGVAREGVGRRGVAREGEYVCFTSKDYYDYQCNPTRQKRCRFGTKAKPVRFLEIIYCLQY